jgi:uncharacterized RDD family membrane protein YckC
MSSMTPLTPQDPSTTELLSYGGYIAQEGIEGVGFWPRVAARIMDLVVHMIVSLFTGLFMGILIAIAAIATNQPTSLLLERMAGESFSTFITAIIGLFAYYVVCESVHGSTLGKLILSMVVVQEDGSPCRFKSALIRNLGYYVDGLFFGLIAYSAMNRSSQRQRYGDDWAHTIVCKRNKVSPDKLRSGGRFALALFAACMADSAILMVGMVLRVLS